MSKPNMKDKIVAKIRAGTIAMTPRTVFGIQLAGLVATSVAILLVTVFIVNFIFFSIRISSHEELLGFGGSGILAFLYFFPWLLAAIDVALVVLLQYLLRQFKFGYRVPVLYIVAALVVGAGVVGFAFDRATPFNDRLFEHRGELPPPFHRIYDGARRPLPPGEGVCRCTILTIDGNTLTVEDTREATTTLTVVLPEGSRRATTTGLSVGDVVLIAGTEEGGVIQAFGVRKLTPGK
ncbi:MAG: hypothetical protein AAB955_03465 [Patescibacteria group bacterium]